MPARYSRVVKALRKLGIKVTVRPGKGSHAIVDDGKGHTYTLPLHHGERTELSDVYLRALCRAFGIDDFEAFRRLL
jgi:predicted RNA binding protein YcfA (HicA-like mRNA interferase family)